MKDIKEKIYNDITALFNKVDGQNKDGIFVTIDGQQYNIKVTAKKNPIIFDANSEKNENNNHHSEAYVQLELEQFLSDQEKQEIKEVFGDRVVDLSK